VGVPGADGGLGESREATIIRRGALDELAAEYPPLGVTFALSGPAWEWAGRAGYVREHRENLFSDFRNRDFYLCGGPDVL